MKPGVIKVLTTARNCQGCRCCEAVCSLTHTGVVSPQYTGILVEEKSELGNFKLTVCQQCFDFPCKDACKTGCISRNAYSGAVEVNEDCIGCGACREACPIKAIRIVNIDGKDRAYKCDLCGGLPQCVSVCPRNVLSW